MKKTLLSILAFASAISVQAQTSAYHGTCTQGATTTVVQGMQSSNEHLSVIGQCLVRVYAHGTPTLQTIYADANKTPLSNPFTAPANGLFLFYVDNTVHLDVTVSGGGLSTTTTSDVTTGGGGSGGSTVVVPGTALQIQATDGNGNLVALQATTDATHTALIVPGALSGKITNGTETASGFQTNGSNGLANAIAACVTNPGVPCSILLDAAYQAGTAQSNNEHDSFWDIGGYYRSSRRYPANTTVNDERGTGLAFGSNYGISSSDGSNLYATGAFHHYSYLYDQNTVELTGAAYKQQNQFVSVWDGVFKARGQDTYGQESISKGEEHNYIFATPGISQGRSVNIHCTKARNDCGADYTQMSVYSGFGNGDDEFNVGRSLEIRTGPVNSNIVPTAQVTSVVGNAMTTALYNGNVNRDWGIHRLVVRQQCGGVDCAIASVPVVSQSAPVQNQGAGYFGNGQYATITIDPTSAGIVPSTCIGQATGTIPVPLSNDIPQAVTFTISLMPGTSCSTSGQMYVLGSRRNQTVNYTAAAQTGPVTINGHSVMQQVITAQMRVDPDAGSGQNIFFPWVFQGGTIGSGAVSELAGFSDGQLSHTKQVVPIAGAIDAHTIVHATHFVTPGLGQYPAFNMMVIPPQAVSVSRQSGVAYITGVSQGGYIYNAAGSMTCPTDSSYNSANVTTAYDGSGLHYPNGSGTSSASVACVWQWHPGANQLNIYNGNEIVNLTPPLLATGGDLGSYIETEPHTWVASVGDVLESDPESSMEIQMDKSNLYLDIPVTALTSQHTYGGMRTGGNIDEDVNLNPLSLYLGSGGPLSPQVRFRLTGLWGGLADIDAPYGGSTIIQGGCANGNCSDPQAGFRMEAWPANGGDSFYRSLSQYYDNAVVAGFRSGPQFSMQGSATGQTASFGMNVPLFMQNHQLRQVATGTDSADAVNLGQMQSAIAAGGGGGTGAANPSSCSANSTGNKCLGVSPYTAVSGDYTTAFQQAINDLTTDGGGTLWIPCHAMYPVNGPLQDTSGANAVIVMPPTALAVGTSTPIHLAGLCDPEVYGSSGGAVIQTSTNASGGSLIGGYVSSGPYGGFIDTDFALDNVYIQSSSTSPNMTMVNAKFFASSKINNVVISSASTAIATTGVGYISPVLSNNVSVSVDHLTVVGFGTLAQISEHTHIGSLYGANSHLGYVFDTEPGTDASHSTWGNTVSVDYLWCQLCDYMVSAGTSQTTLNIQALDAEVTTTALINDPNNLLLGDVYYNVPYNDGRSTSTITNGIKNGATKLRLHNLKYPDVSLGTALAGAPAMSGPSVNFQTNGLQTSAITQTSPGTVLMNSDTNSAVLGVHTTSTSTSAFEGFDAGFYPNDATFVYVPGTFSGSGFVQPNEAILSTDPGASNGLVIATQNASAPIKLYTNSNLALTVNSSDQSITASSSGAVALMLNDSVASGPYSGVTATSNGNVWYNHILGSNYTGALGTFECWWNNSAHALCWSPTAIKLPSASVFGWGNSSDPSTVANDTGFSRTAAGTVAVGNGVQGDASGTLLAASVLVGGKKVCLADGTNCTNSGGTTLPASIAAVATDSQGNVITATYLGLEGIFALDPRPRYDEYGPGDGSALPTPASGNEALAYVAATAKVSRIRSDGSSSPLCDSSGEGCPAAVAASAIITGSVAIPQYTTDSCIAYTIAMSGTISSSSTFAFSFTGDPGTAMQAGPYFWFIDSTHAGTRVCELGDSSYISNAVTLTVSVR